MVLLAVDTSGKDGSVALVRVSSPDTIEPIEVIPLSGGTFSAQLIPQIAALLQKHGFQKTDLAGFAVASGPGSFTGLRVGLAAIKGLAEVLHKPIAAVSRLEALARSGAAKGRVLAALNAGRGELYVGDYELGSPVRMNGENLLRWDELIASVNSRLVVVQEQGLAEKLRAADIKVELVAPPRADVIARFGWEKIQRGGIIPPDQLEANYIRRSDAEIFSPPKP